MKRLIALLLTVVVTLSLCACASSTPSGKLPGKPSDSYVGGNLGQQDEDAGKESQTETQHSDKKTFPSDEQTVSPETQPETTAGVPMQQFSAAGEISLKALREEIAQAGAVFGVAYLGSYFQGEMTYEEWFESTAYDLIGLYPFVDEIDRNHTLGSTGHMYCILGGDSGDAITAKTLDGQILYEATNGDPILIFCNRDGEGMIADTIVTVTTPDGTEYQWEARLDGSNYPELLIGAERQLLSWDFTYVFDLGFELTGWLSEGWLGPTQVGLAGTDVLEGMHWWIYTTDGTRIRYCLSFFPNAAHNYDGEVTLECFYGDDDVVQAQWQGWWNLSTIMDNASWLHMDLMLMNGADKDAFEASSVISENYMTLLSPSGEELLLVADTTQTVLPLFPDGWRFGTLSLAMG